MRHTIILFVCCLLALTGTAQLISLHNKLAENRGDTAIFIQYFKSPDSILVKQLDSFDLYLESIQYKLDSSFFYTISFEVRQSKKRSIISYNSEYCDYIRVANLSKNKSPYRYRTVFAFFFYKNKLVLCDILSRNLRLTSDGVKLLTNLIYENVNENEKRLISGYPQYEYNLLSKPVKGYNFE